MNLLELRLLQISANLGIAERELHIPLHPVYIQQLRQRTRQNGFDQPLNLLDRLHKNLDLQLRVLLRLALRAPPH
ncbi:hypothetical protein D3C84_1128990 [compost metagenome]